jgi:dihydroorotate dehydrogenase (NAD+) catalytic subunit
VMGGSWAVSFGMPSRPPDVWRRDVEWTRRRLASEKLLCVSVVGTMQPGWTLGDLAQDYARCARWAVESGADCVEANLSCPNVSSRDGQLYQQPEAARAVATTVREAVGSTPLLLKIGHLRDAEAAGALARSVAHVADGLAMTNCIAATVADADGRPLFDGEPRGIGGTAILDASIAQVERFRDVVATEALPLRLIGVGGAGSAADVLRYLRAGAHAVQIATAAMLEPRAGLAIRRGLAGALHEQV